MSARRGVLEDWLNALPSTDGLVRISQPRGYHHAEEDYDAQYGGVSERESQQGLGLCRLAELEGLDTAAPALEIGCGSGRLTCGLALGSPWPVLLVTDPSPAFLGITRRKLARLDLPASRVRYAILNADELHLLPPASLSAVILRSTLHHILEVEAFLGNCARCLRPGGALVMAAEPCVEGYVLMAAIAQFVPLILRGAGVPLTPGREDQIRLFLDTIRFYSRQDVAKAEAEDKHLFHPHELSVLFDRCGMRFTFYPNASPEQFLACDRPEVPRGYFRRFFLDYLKFCMSFEPAFVDLIAQHVGPYLEYVEDCYQGRGNSPYLTGVYVAKRA